jgi:hypothetical protein
MHIRLRRDRGQCGKCLLICPGYKLCITKALVVSTVAQKLSGILKEIFYIVITDTSLLLQSLPVAIASLVELYNEVEDAL